jgi:hypothetical protein
MLAPVPSRMYVVGPGQIGRWLASAALADGTTVVPVRRNDSVETIDGPLGTPILLAVPESAWEQRWLALPTERRADVIFVQNDLFPHDVPWHGDETATFAAVWVLRKPGFPEIVGNTTGVGGRHAQTVARWCETLGVGGLLLRGHEVVDELAAKWAFLLVANAWGLAGAVVLGDEVAGHDRDALLDEACALAEVRAGRRVSEAWLRERVSHALVAMAGMPARGRTARSRVERALALASPSIAVPALSRAVQSSAL